MFNEKMTSGKMRSLFSRIWYRSSYVGYDYGKHQYILDFSYDGATVFDAPKHQSERYNTKTELVARLNQLASSLKKEA